MRTAASLDALNFSLAGAREGFGPFLGVYLQQLGWGSAAIGVAMGVAGLAGVLTNAPIGALIDRSPAKRSLVIAAVAIIALGAVTIVLAGNRWIVGLSQVAIGVADDAIAPLIAALTLGFVGQHAYGDRVGRNETFNHAGNAASAVLAGLLGYYLGLGWIAVSIVVMAVLSTAAVLTIDTATIDQREARSGDQGEEPAWRTLLGSRPLLILAGAAFLLQTANGAMLPFLAQARTSQGANPGTTTAIMVVTAQTIMIGAAFLAAKFARRRGHEHLLTLALIAIAVRGAVAAFTDGWILTLIAQGLEGIAMGCAGVAIPALAAGAMSGTGRANMGLGGVMAAYGAGATLSPLLAGFGVQFAGYPATFIAMSMCAGLGALLWVFMQPRHEAAESSA